MVRISVVSYLNSKPFIYGLRNSGLITEIELSEDIPSICAEKMITGKADIGLVPVAILPLLKDCDVISNYCIGSDGAVNSVLLLSEVPLNEIQTVLLDYQSRTSVLLTKVLSNKFWKISPKWETTTNSFEKQIKQNTAGVVIGDRALKMKSNFKYAYDLSAEWKKYTGLPFVFACWAGKKGLDKQFNLNFNEAIKSGINKINIVAKEEKSEHFTEEEILAYLTDNIDYNFNDSKKEALKLFLKFVGELEIG